MESKHRERISRREKVKKEKVTVSFSELPKNVKAVFALIPLAISFCTLVANLNNDTWFLLKYGQVICESGLPFKDPLSMHSDFDIVVQQWLTDVIFWRIYSFAGKYGLLVLVMLFTLVITFIVYKASMIVSNNNLFVSLICAVASECTLLFFVMTTRPQVFTICILLCQLLLYEKYMQKSEWKYLIGIPILSALLINFHASMWIVQFVIVLPFLVDSCKFDFKFIKCQGAKILPLIISSATAFAAGFLNPYGLKAMTYVFRSYGISYINKFITEMKPTNIKTSAGFIGIVLFCIALVINFMKKDDGVINTRVRNILFIVGFGYMMFSNLRNAMFIFAFAPYTVAYCLRDIDIKVPYEKNVSKKSKIMSAVLLVLLAGVTAAFFFSLDGINTLSNVFITENDINSEDRIEYTNSQTEGAVEYILDNYPQAQDLKIYSGYNDGAYLEFNGIHPYIDPRAEVFLKANNSKEDVLEEYYNLQCEGSDEKAFLNKYDFDLILVSKNDVLYDYLENDNDYKELYSDNYCDIYEKVN